NGNPLKTTLSDEYGDFKFDGREGHSGTYTIQFNSIEHGEFETTADLGESVYLGILKLYGRSS
ncbi:MAG: oxidoreductase, partial [Pseudomonadota bacterium]|nr:oxidoreductase [Pseudomonadota bacterium]